MFGQQMTKCYNCLRETPVIETHEFGMQSEFPVEEKTVVR